MLQSSSSKTTATVFGNATVLVTLLVWQNAAYDDILEMEVSKKFGDIDQTVRLLEQFGDDMNVILGLCAGLFLMNIWLFRNVIRSKRWILKPVALLVLSFVLSIGYHSYRGKVVGNEIKTMANTR
jgi:hypothetical protein